MKAIFSEEVEREGDGLLIWLLVILLSLLSFVPEACAESEPQSVKVAPFDRECSYYRSPEDFVRRAALFCIGAPSPRACQAKSRKYFNSCRFDGDFKMINRSVHTDMLFMLVLARASRISG